MKMLLYCTKAKSILSEVEYCYGDENKTKYECIPDTKKGNEYLEQMGFGEFLNGKIVGECDFEVEEFDFISEQLYKDDVEKYNTEIRKQNEICKKSCLSVTEIVFYLDTKALGTKNPNGMIGYAIHIKNLKVFDKPKELSDYCNFDKNNALTPITKAPQNMMYATQHLGEPMYVENHYIGLDDYFEDYVLISIRPEGLCKILNGECTIIVRKRVLKGMLENDK